MKEVRRRMCCDEVFRVGKMLTTGVKNETVVVVVIVFAFANTLD